MRPAINVTLGSVAKQSGNNVVAAILTGMGSDGTRGCELVKAAGGYVVAQDEATSTIYGMPRSVAEAGLADEVRPLEELADLRDMITIDVTEFFRDQAQWQQLRSAVLPELLKQRDRAVSIWSAGCSTGQEPYSLAMQLSEAKALARASILCTDFDHDTLAKARAGGPYTATEIEGIPEGEISQHFNESDDGFTASVALRRHLEFKELNLLKDRFGRGYDLVVCRNVMIYFNSGVKSGLVARFVESLKPGGVLFIGATEALLGHDLDGLERLGGNFYRKRAEAAVMDRAA